MAGDFKIPRLYKTLLALAAVIGPMAWLLFTEDGQRRTDMVFMWLLGRPPFDAALDMFSDGLTESRLRESFPALELQCTGEATPFGNRVCTAPIGSFNQFPARAVSLYFEDDRAVAAKVTYRRAYHDRIRAWADRRTDAAAAAPADTDASDRDAARPASAVPRPAPGEGVRQWPASDGLLLMKNELAPSDEPALLWLSERALAGYANAVR